MCTVTFLPLKGSIVLTSNRDEQVLREPAALPEPIEFEHGKILFPRDGKAGGTWIALHNNGNVMILLNGGFKRHTPSPPYFKSRGLIFLDIFDADQPELVFEQIPLINIEPFTLVIWSNGKLFEARWDGTEKYLTPKSATTPHIWLSSTLYDDQVIALRKKWFSKWLSSTTYKTIDSIRHFHEFGGEDGESVFLRMNKEGILQTVSITSIEIKDNNAVMCYKDILGGIVSVNEWHLKDQLHHI